MAVSLAMWEPPLLLIPSYRFRYAFLQRNLLPVAEIRSGLFGGAHCTGVAGLAGLLAVQGRVAPGHAANALNGGSDGHDERWWDGKGEQPLAQRRADGVSDLIPRVLHVAAQEISLAGGRVRLGGVYHAAHEVAGVDE